MRFSGRTATGIIPFPSERILLIKRSTPPFIGYWALPGGRSEPGETEEQTIIRETKEETGLDTRVVRKIGEYHEQGLESGFEYDYYPACFLLQQTGGEIRKQESEIDDIKLFGLEEIPQLMAFEHARMIKDYVSQMQKRVS
jgi:ADP-ribose pyrophosphatase YjhB (NUDIX family)